MSLERKQLILRIILTLGSLEFFGPALRDSDVSHLLNPHWPGHAKVHMMWFIGYFFMSGVMQIYLIWFRRPTEYGLVLGWQLCNLIGFWAAVALSPVYGGAVIDPEYHAQVLGINENIVAFVSLSTIWCVAVSVFLTLRRRDAQYV